MQNALRRAFGVLFRLRCLTTDVNSMASQSLEEYLAPPQSVRGSTVLDYASFKRDVVLPGIRLQEASLCAKFLKRLSRSVIHYPGIKRVVSTEDEQGEEKKVILLTPDQCLERPLSPSDHQWIADNGGTEIFHTVSLDYSSYTKQAVLRAVIPPEIETVPSAFEQVGHIVHLNLKEEHLPYKKVIGQVLLDKQSYVRTVVNKTDQIDSTYRFFKMELLAGEDDMIATVKENECTFTFDFSKVYWNSRLHTEHERIVNLVKRSDVVLDVFAGVGPFAIPLAKKGCVVYANDLNPHSYKYLCENCKLNRVDSRLRTHNMDGREFIQTLTKELLEKALQKEGDTELVPPYSHVLMNLPASAVEFLDTFNGLFRMVPEGARGKLTLPIIHCYCFVKQGGGEQFEEPVDTVAQKLGIDALKEGTYSVSTVRRVAPNKDMVRVSFQFPPEVAFSNTSSVTPTTYIPSSQQPPEQYIGMSESLELKGEGSLDVVSGNGPSPKRSRLE